MSSGPLRATAFRGDPDVEALHDFFRPELQFAGDTLWSFGTSLKAAYVDSFEFMNHPPVVQLWRDADDTIQAVSRISLGPGKWFHQAAPAHRGPVQFGRIAAQADAAFELLSEHESWQTVCYRSKTIEIARLESCGYVADGIADVHMRRPLDGPIELAPPPAGVDIRLLDTSDASLLRDRAFAQVDAFTDDPPTPTEIAWIIRSMANQLAYGRPAAPPHVIAVDSDGSILAFADTFFDEANAIAEFEPVGTRPAARRRGLARAVMTRGLREMRERGMREAVVRTGADNAAAIAAYRDVGFEITDELVDFRKQRE